MKEFTHCNKNCRFNDHCHCAFECGLYMVYDGCSEFNTESSDPGWSVQAERDFIG